MPALTEGITFVPHDDEGRDAEGSSSDRRKLKPLIVASICLAVALVIKILDVGGGINASSILAATISVIVVAGVVLFELYKS